MPGNTMQIAVVLPIKQLNRVKGRLAGVLNEVLRQQLFTAMVRDVLMVVSSTSGINRVIVVTDDPAVAALVAPWQVEVTPEPATPGLIESVTAAGEMLAKASVDAMVFLPGDTPLLTVEELEAVIASINMPNPENKPRLTIVPASDLGGSNCVACCPPDAMRFGFGEDSFRRHLAYAKDLGVEVTVLKQPGMGLDVDTPDDLKELMARLQKDETAGRHTRTFLREAGISEQF